MNEKEALIIYTVPMLISLLCVGIIISDFIEKSKAKSKAVKLA
jgi:VIT1/CCC1 family predicted Fe2+/Mn2+ transporter